MRIVLKNILTICFSILLAACMILAFAAGANSRRVILCKKVRIEILDSLENSFVTRSDVKTFIDREYGKYIGTPIDSLNLTKIEKIVDGRSAVLKSQAYVTRDGVLNIKVTQRKPVVRFQKPDGGFYADAEGYIFPLQKAYASHVQVIDGNIPLAANSGYKGSIGNKAEQEWFRNVMNVVNYIENNRKWRGKVVQIHIDKNQDLIIIPREGNEIFRFGKPDEIQDKFSRMEKYYTHIIPAKEQDTYKEVDLKYKGQIVCRRNRK